MNSGLVMAPSGLNSVASVVKTIDRLSSWRAVGTRLISWLRTYGTPRFHSGAAGATDAALLSPDGAVS